MKVKYHKLHQLAIEPTKGTPQSAAYDLSSIETVWIPPGQTVAVATGLSMEIPEGWKGEIYSRSGMSSQGTVVANSPGKIDSDYRGEIMVLLHNQRLQDVACIEPGDRIAQFEINPVHPLQFEIVEELSSTQRGDAGFGSTGK